MPCVIPMPPTLSAVVPAQAELGHSDIRTTKKYADALLEQRQKAVNNLSFDEINVNVDEKLDNKGRILKLKVVQSASQ